MRIKSIYVKSYKNISEQTLELSGYVGYVALIGLNNSGKSNWLEAISLIFREFFMGTPCGFEYRVLFESEGSTFELTHDHWIMNGAEVPKNSMHVPSNIIACYSGESLRLWHKAYEDYYAQFFSEAVKNEYDEPQMLYVNKYNWAICLIAMMCSEDGLVQNFLRTHLGIEDTASVEVSFELEEKNVERYHDNEVMRLINRIYTPGQSESWIAMPTLGSFELGAQNREEHCRKLFYLLFLAAMPKKLDSKQADDRVINDISIQIGGRSLEDVSEGEKKLILITCITRILADKNSILLLDEPDAHVHMANKIQMRDYFESYDGQIFLTTHSPLFADLLGHDNLKFIENGRIEDVDKNKRISTLSDGYITLVDGAFLITTKKVVVTEGHTDIVYIKQAVEKLSEEDEKYRKLKKLSFIAQGSADHTRNFCEDTIQPVIDTLDKVLFIFDYDTNGMNGAKVIKEKHDPKWESIYYSADYSKEPELYYLEDFFPTTCYETDLKAAVKKITDARSYRDIKKKSNDLGSSVKTTISKNFLSFPKERYAGFKPLLDKLIAVFGL